MATKEHAVARQPVMQRLNQIMRGYVKIASGTHADEIPRGATINQDRQLCIMEATAYILGYENISDSPPCTSEQIRVLMIEINDSVGSRKRAKLKDVIPDIINTAPTIWVEHRRHQWVLRTDEHDPQYNAAESERADIIDKYENEKKMMSGMEVIVEMPMTKIIPIIRQLAAVAKFSGTKERPLPPGEKPPATELQPRPDGDPPPESPFLN